MRACALISLVCSAAFVIPATRLCASSDSSGQKNESPKSSGALRFFDELVAICDAGLRGFLDRDLTLGFAFLPVVSGDLFLALFVMSSCFLAGKVFPSFDDDIAVQRIQLDAIAYTLQLLACNKRRAGA